MISHLRPALVLFGALTVVCGVIYPYAVTGIGQAVFPEQANGSLLQRGGVTVGSRLIGQNFSAAGYFWGRPSATAPMVNNGAGSGGSNQGPLNPALLDAVKARVDALKAADPGNSMPVPADLVTASASGLDPEISLGAARYQLRRVAAARELPQPAVEALIAQHEQKALFGVFGEARVNVLELNLALDALHK
jgi:K+-transporting ATPase ATPase C chain